MSKIVSALYGELQRIAERPLPFVPQTARTLWTDEHISEQMLAYHLDGEIDVCSRRTAFIEESVGWIAGRFGLDRGCRLLDLGCGPGLYASRLSEAGAQVVGVDFSSRSVAYAREQAARRGLGVVYECSDYLEFEPEGEFDLVTMIMCDFCAMSPAERRVLLEKVRQHLSGTGRFLFDVYSLVAYERKKESSSYERHPEGGFWSSAPHHVLVNAFKYPIEQVSVDRFAVVEPERTREVFTWLQYFSPETLRSELAGAGLEIEECLGNVAGGPFDESATEFAVVVRKA